MNLSGSAQELVTQAMKVLIWDNGPKHTEESKTAQN